jgi:hypothetical protein
LPIATTSFFPLLCQQQKEKVINQLIIIIKNYSAKTNEISGPKHETTPKSTKLATNLGFYISN